MHGLGETPRGGPPVVVFDIFLTVCAARAWQVCGHDPFHRYQSMLRGGFRQVSGWHERSSDGNNHVRFFPSETVERSGGRCTLATTAFTADATPVALRSIPGAHAWCCRRRCRAMITSPAKCGSMATCHRSCPVCVVYLIGSLLARCLR